MDYYNTQRKQGEGHTPTSPNYQTQYLDRRLPDRPLPDWIPSRASPPMSVRSSISEQIPLPNWARDHSISLNPRPSRASSIVSTRTKTSINTAQEDSRSIDIVLGPRSFHINRDGSNISVSNKEELPPYSLPAPGTHHPNPGNPPTQLTIVADPSQPNSGEIAEDHQSNDLHESPESGSAHTLFSPAWSFPNDHQYPWTVSTPRNDENLPTPPGNMSEPRSGMGPETAPIKPEEPNTWKRLPVDPSLGVPPIGSRRSVSQGNIHEVAQLMDGTKDTVTWLRRRYAVRLPKIITNDPGRHFRRNSEHTSPAHVTRSAGPSLGRNNYKPSAFQRDIGHKRHPSPSPRSSVTVPKLSLSLPGPGGAQLAVPESPVHVEEGHAETEAPPPMESDNDISIHYTRLIRSIDRDHRRALHMRDKELASMRERLNEVDQVYRKELKARDFTIDDLRSRLNASEENMQTRIEDARNEVEDLWEMRWKDRDRHLMERMRRIELDSQKCVERAVAERDEEWGVEWAKKNDQLLARLKVAEETTRQNPLLS